jgi:hypothetical protein
VYLKREAYDAWSAADADPRESEHFRIRDMVLSIEDSECYERQAGHLEPDVPPAHAALAPVGEHGTALVEPGELDALRAQYDGSIGRIEQSIYVIASAVTALDSIEGKLAQVRLQIDELRRRGEAVNIEKARDTVAYLANHVSSVVERIDEQHVNFLRDTRINLRFAEIEDPTGEHAMNLEFTLISLEKLMAYRMREGIHDVEDLRDLIESVERVVHNNLHVLSGMVMVMFAARDYTDEVTRLVLSNALQLSSRRDQRAGSPAVLQPPPPPAAHPMPDHAGWYPPEETRNGYGVEACALHRQAQVQASPHDRVLQVPPPSPGPVTQKARTSLMALLGQMRARAAS